MLIPAEGSDTKIRRGQGYGQKRKKKKGKKEKVLNTYTVYGGVRTGASVYYTI